MKLFIFYLVVFIFLGGTGVLIYSSDILRFRSNPADGDVTQKQKSQFR